MSEVLIDEDILNNVLAVLSDTIGIVKSNKHKTEIASAFDALDTAIAESKKKNIAVSEWRKPDVVTDESGKIKYITNIPNPAIASSVLVMLHNGDVLKETFGVLEGRDDNGELCEGIALDHYSWDSILAWSYLPKH
jgi:hypothetical protein